jgi:hypothetical protein
MLEMVAGERKLTRTELSEQNIAILDMRRPNILMIISSKLLNQKIDTTQNDFRFEVGFSTVVADCAQRHEAPTMGLSGLCQIITAR